MARILVVDDTDLLRTMLADVLRQGGHTVLTAKDGKEALDLLRREAPDLLVTDYYMPTMDGGELIRAVRRGEVGRVDLPIIALAGSRHAEQSTIEAGADVYLAKPLRKKSLRAVVEDLLTKK